MKIKITIICFLCSVWVYAQTTIQFAEPHRFLEVSEDFLYVSVQVNNIAQYPADKPIIFQLFSDLEDISILGITATRRLDKVILPGQYTNGETIRIPVQAEALKGVQSFNLFLGKKEGDEGFTIFQDRCAVILKESKAGNSYIGISVAAMAQPEVDNLLQKKIDIPFTIEARGSYIPVEADEVFAKVKIKGLEGSDSLSTFLVAGPESNYKISIEKKRNPELYKKLRKILAMEAPLELELSGLEHRAKQQIETDPAKKTARIDVKAVERLQSGLKETQRLVRAKKADSLDARYTFYAGVNFDFNNNFKFEEAYYEVDVSLYNLFKNRWGLRAGIYKNNNSRSLAESFRYEWLDNTLVEHDNEDIIYTRKTLDIAANVATESLGFYFELPYKVMESGNFSVFISPYIELIKRIEKYTYEVVGESTEETIIVPVSNPVTTLEYATLWQENTTRYWDSYFGISFPMLYRNPGLGFEVFVHPVIGSGYPRKAADRRSFDVTNDLITTYDPGLSFFSAFQFYLAVSAKDVVGFKLGADLRKYFYAGQRPTISVTLSTQLDLSGIMSLTGTN